MSDPLYPADVAARRSRRSQYLALLLILVFSLLLAACAPNAPQDVLKPEGPIAQKADRLWDFTFGVAVVIFFIVEGLLVIAIFRFRQRSENESPVQVHHNTRLEVAWTLVPVVLLAGVAVPTVASIFDLAERPKGDVVEVRVVGHQWWWEYDYTDLGVLTANEMHIPVNKPVYLTLESEDVIHSFWVPKLAGKQDVVPGKKLNMTIEASKPGVYLGQCAEFCGLSHANMRLKVIAHSQPDFDAWVNAYKQADAEPTGLAAQGKKLFLEGACAGCHAINGTTAQARVGPNLTDFATRTSFGGATFDNTTGNLSKWLADAPAIKPGSKMPSGKKELGLSDSDIVALIAYLQTLK